MSLAVAPVQVHGEVGSGATGRVWRGVLTREVDGHPKGTEVAVKRLHPALGADPKALAALAREADIGRRAVHPGLVRVLCHGEDDEGPYLISGFIPGRSLRQVLETDGPLPEPLLRAVAAQVAGGLAALHTAGCVHRDVKPENMRLDVDGRAVLLDLGFARRGEAQETEELGAAGSLAYLSPERARGQAGGPESDVFALGVVLYELATGVHPFAVGTQRTGESSALPMRRSIESPGADVLLARIVTAQTRPASHLVPQLSPFLDRLLASVLVRNPRLRPKASELAQRLLEQEAGEWWRAQLDGAGHSTRGTATGVETSHRTHMAGRDRELGFLSDQYDRAARGPTPAGGVVWIDGALGSGKSRLVSEFATRVRTSQQPPLFLYGRCSAREDQRPAAPVLGLVMSWLGLSLHGFESGPRERAELERLLPPREAETLLQTLAAHPGSATEWSVQESLARWLIALGKSERAIVFLDDLTFASEATLNVISSAARNLGETRMLLVLGLREHERARRPRSLARLRKQLEAQARELRVGPIDAAAVRELVDSTFHSSAPRLRIARVLMSRSRGNPGLITEILRGLTDRGEAVPHPSGGGLTLTISPERLPLPASLQTLTRERYRRLPRADRRWLRRFSVVGGRLQADFLARALAPATAPEIDDALVRLTKAGWLEPAGGRYRFARPALREAVYNTLHGDERRREHAAAAHALAPGPGQELTLADAYQRVFHLRAAREHSQMMRVLRPLMRALILGGQAQQVLTLARWGLEALDALPPTPQRSSQRIAFLEAAADASDRLGHREEQRRWLDQLSDMNLTPEKNREEVVRVYLLHGRYAFGTGQYGLARGFLRQAVELSAPLVASPLRSESLLRLAGVQTRVGEMNEGRKLGTQALNSALNHRQRAVALLHLALIDLLGDALERALNGVKEALRLVRSSPEQRLPGVVAAGHMLRGRIYRVSGRPRRALASIQAALRLAQLAGERRTEAEATARLGGLLLDLDQPDEAQARLREALLLAGEIEDRRGQALSGTWLGILLWEVDDPQALETLQRARRLAAQIGLQRTQALCLAIEARIALAAHRLQKAQDDAEQAFALLSRFGAELPDQVVITGTLAMVLDSGGQGARARELVKELRKSLLRVNGEIADALTKRRHRTATTRLLEAVLSSEGVIYPRVRLLPGQRD